MSKRTLDAFFRPSKKPKSEQQQQKEDHNQDVRPPDTHPTYPIPIAKLPTHIENALSTTPAREGKIKIMNDQPDLDCLYFQPFIPRSVANDLFDFLRAELPFYRVVYFAKRGGVDVEVNTPRYTTVFGVDESCLFVDPTVNGDVSVNGSDNRNPKLYGDGDGDGDGESKTHPPASALASAATPTPTTYSTTNQTLQRSNSNTIPKYGHPPRPIPSSLQTLKKTVESATKTSYNFVLVNYYASGEDSIAFHSDDERFLGFEPAIASLSLGAERKFLLKHKPPPPNTTTSSSTSSSSVTGGGGSGGSAGGTMPAASTSTSTIKLPLHSGDMILMRGRTQSNWLHSIPKRKRAGAGGRINITFRRAVIPAGTDNYYHYNVGVGGVYRWDEVKREMEMVQRGGG